MGGPSGRTFGESQQTDDGAGEALTVTVVAGGGAASFVWKIPASTALNTRKGHQSPSATQNGTISTFSSGWISCQPCGASNTQGPVTATCVPAGGTTSGL